MLKLYKKAVDARIAKGEGKDEAIIKELQVAIKASKKIRFEGNGYGDEWATEAEKRGLSNVKTTPLALDAYVSKESKALYTGMNIYTIPELEARHEIMLEDYTMKIQIEGRVMGDLAMNHIIPTAFNYQNKLITNVKGLKDIGVDKEVYSETLSMITEISEHIKGIKVGVDNMTAARKKANTIEDARDTAIAYCDNVVSHFDEIRYHADKLELMIDDEDWPLAKYREMLFLR